jgi:hypothetical protein
MPQLSYNKPGLVMERGRQTRAGKGQIKDLQRDLRQLGYLKSGVDGIFGRTTESAVKALRHDLLYNVGKSSKDDGPAPVRVVDFNRGRIVEVNGLVDKTLAGCISDMLDDTAFPKLPKSDDPVQENRRLVSILEAMETKEIPVPFLLAILKQESGLKHYNEPSEGDDDTYIVVGLDTNAREKHIITSRGYGAGQYTIFHHPPRPEEVTGFMDDVQKNVTKAIAELREKFDQFVLGDTTGTRADDRIAEYGEGQLRECKFDKADQRFMRDCARCAGEAGTRDIVEGETRLYKGSKFFYVPTQYYKSASYKNVPVREKLGCDWPYAVRRYNGAGINSYHYQARVLKNLL